ncbi:MAG TPA: 2-phospho-L-lactate guanylyltransferase [Acidimicrobiales bacterium]|nr:2-phospho-L-lactate guanylyltransferase [Acidimicrobiales bacterium]
MEADAAVLVPVKAFGEAKRRLSPALAAPERAALSRRLAAGVIAAAAPLAVAVVCEDREVAGWARELGALVIWEPGRGLNGAVAAGVARLAAEGVTTVAVAHGDLARPAGLVALVLSNPGGVTLVPDGRDDGTNVVVLPGAVTFRFSYGPGSFRRHLDEATASGLAVQVVRGTDLSLDVDLPSDLPLTAGAAPGRR